MDTKSNFRVCSIQWRTLLFIFSSYRSLNQSLSNEQSMQWLWHSRILLWLIKFDLHERCFLKLSLSRFYPCVVLGFTDDRYFRQIIKKIFLSLRFAISYTSRIIFLVSLNNHRRIRISWLSCASFYPILHPVIKTVCVMLSFFFFLLRLLSLPDNILLTTTEGR